MSRTCREIISAIEVKYPLSLAEDYDNVGLIIGDSDAIIDKILVCLDINEAVIEEAVNNGVNMIVSHHPIIFKGLKKIVYSDPVSSMIASLIKANLCVYALHTNFDNAESGMNDILAERLELTDVNKLGNGTGRYGSLKSEMKLSELCSFVKRVLDVPVVKASGNLNDKVSSVAIVGGAGYDFIDAAVTLKCDVLITGDVKHHAALDAVSSKISLIDAGHYYTEVIALPYIANLFNTLTGVDTIITKINTNPFKDV